MDVLRMEFETNMPWILMAKYCTPLKIQTPYLFQIIQIVKYRLNGLKWLCVGNIQGVGIWISCIYVLWSSGISRTSGALIVRYSQKKKWISFVFYCSENPSLAHNFGTTGEVGFSAKCTSSNEHFNQKENWKCHMFVFRLISLDRITYNCLRFTLICPIM